MKFVLTLAALLLVSVACSRNSEEMGTGAGTGAPARENGSSAPGGADHK